MAKRDPGKFSSDLDAALYEMTTEGPDAELGSSSEPPYLWAGLLKSGVDVARAIEGVHASGEGGYEGVDAEDLAFLRSKGKAGVIVTENDQGFVETVFYDNNDKLWKDWEDLERELEVSDDEEFEENAGGGDNPLTVAQEEVLDSLDFSSDNEVWWHDLPAGTRDVLYRQGLIHEVRKEKCGTPGHDHPGYVGITERGKQALALAKRHREDLYPKERRLKEHRARISRTRNSKLSKGYTKYGADMGRHSTPVSGKVTLERMRIDSGGYDSGGAYWGTGEPLWRAQDEDGNEQFFRAKDRKAAEAELGDDVTIVRSSERENEGTESKLETDGTLSQLLESTAESNELPGEYWRDLEVTPELSLAARNYENALWGALSELVTNIPPNGDADANVLMEDGDAPYNVYLTLSGSGTGIRDYWGEYYDDDVLERKVRPFLRARIGKWVDDSGSGKLNDALMNAVYENEQRLGIERDDDNNVIGRDDEDDEEEREPNGSNGWVVTLNGEQVDVVFFSDDMDADDVKRSLVSHDGFDPRIVVKKRQRRLTHAPDALAENPGDGFANITEIKAVNKAAGGHWFEPATLRFFRSRVESKVYGGKYFVTSEQQDDLSQRKYTVREAHPDGSISTVGKFQGYTFKEDAVDAIKGFLKSPARVPNRRRSPSPSA